jgi:hypothetical protein
MDLRRLFDRHQIPWKDTGPNTHRGNVNIRCPWCPDDPSFHLAVSDHSNEFYCFRNPKHAGNNLGRIFYALKIPSSEWRDYKFTTVERVYIADGRDYSAFRYFLPASESPEAIDYLYARLFERPLEICQQFNLKVAKEGEWAGRLIVPLTIGWLGRSMRSHLLLRYKAHTSADGFFKYSHGGTSVLVLEGSIDCMRCASVSSQYDVVGKCGNRLSAALLDYLKSKDYVTIYNSPDSTVPFLQYFEETKILRSYCTKSRVVRTSMPEGEGKDYGATTESATRRLLSSLA